MKFSIIIPARDEELYIGKCLGSIEAAGEPYVGEVQVIVVINRCTDNTEQIAREFGAKIVYNNNRNLSIIRNSEAQPADLLSFSGVADRLFPGFSYGIRWLQKECCTGKRTATRHATLDDHPARSRPDPVLAREN